MLLLIDIGNTRIKWARSSEDGALSEQVAAVHATWTRDDFIQQVLNSGPRAERVLIAQRRWQAHGRPGAQCAVPCVADRT